MEDNAGQRNLEVKRNNMSREIKKRYTGFGRKILREFMSEKELRDLDKRYTEAKIARTIRRIKNGGKA